MSETTLPLDVYAALARRAQPRKSCDRPEPKPTDVPPGPEKVPVLRLRHKRKEALWHELDVRLPDRVGMRLGRARLLAEELCIGNQRIRNGRDKGVRLSIEALVRRHKDEVRRRKKEGNGK